MSARTGVYRLARYGTRGDLAFRNIISETADRGAIILVDPGTYYIDSPVVFPNYSGLDNGVNWKVIMHPQASLVIASGSHGLIFDGSEHRIGRGHTKSTGVFGGKIWCGSNTAMTTGNLISFKHTDGGTVEDVELRGGTIGVDFDGCWSGLVLDSFLVRHRHGIAIHNTSIDIKIERIGLYDCDLNGIILYNGGNRTCSVMRSYLEQVSGNVINQDATSHELMIAFNFFNDNRADSEMSLPAAGNRVIANSFSEPHRGVGINIMGRASCNIVGLNVSRGYARYEPGWIQISSPMNTIVGNAADDSGEPLKAIPGNVIGGNTGF